jgi:5'-deoxynucleotidase YfbR-like HD superfamily hydrolase
MSRSLKEYLSSADVEDIYSTAQLAHMGQKRRSGKDYFSHPVAVADIIKRLYPGDNRAYLVALLHDTIEDTESVGNITIPELEEFISGSITDRSEYEAIISAVRSLTHSKNTPYADYLLSLASSPLALRVKLADMLHNLTSSPSPTQAQKYEDALSELEDEFGGTPPGVSDQHMSRLNKVISEGMIRSIIRNIIIEVESTIKYNGDPALKGDQTKLPDKLQKGIIDKDDEDENLEEILQRLRGKNEDY